MDNRKEKPFFVRQNDNTLSCIKIYMKAHMHRDDASKLDFIECKYGLKNLEEWTYQNYHGLRDYDCNSILKAIKATTHFPIHDSRGHGCVLPYFNIYSEEINVPLQELPALLESRGITLTINDPMTRDLFDLAPGQYQENGHSLKI